MQIMHSLLTGSSSSFDGSWRHVSSGQPHWLLTECSTTPWVEHICVCEYNTFCNTQHTCYFIRNISFHIPCWHYPPHHSLLVGDMLVQDNYTGQSVRQPPELSIYACVSTTHFVTPNTLATSSVTYHFTYLVDIILLIIRYWLVTYWFRKTTLVRVLDNLLSWAYAYVSITHVGAQYTLSTSSITYHFTYLGNKPGIDCSITSCNTALVGWRSSLRRSSIAG